MLQSTPMLSQQDSADPRACQCDNARPVWTRTESADTHPIIAAVVRAYNDTHLAADVTHTAILSASHATHVAHARHLCAYLLVEDYHLTNVAAARALGRADHTTVLNSRTRVITALGHDVALQQTLTDARDILSGHAGRAHPRRDHGRPQAFATATPQELAEYRYWRLRSLRAGAPGGAR